MRILVSVMLAALLALNLPAQSSQEAQTPSKSGNDQSAPKVDAKQAESLKPPLEFGLEDGTPIKLRLTRNLSSADATVGERVDFEVLEEVRVKDVLIVPRGGLALATITEAQAKRRMARGGKLNVNIDDLRLIDGEKAALRAVKEAKGGGHTGAMTGAIVGTAIVFFPAAPLFLFMHGKDITIPKGTEITAYINGDIPLDRNKFQPVVKATADVAMNQATPAQDVLASIELKSTPDNADITVDEKFMGNTPAVIKLPAGDHKIKIEKSGFKAWEKTLTVSSGGSLSLNATLEQRQQ
jgi:PEGA domain